MRIEYYVATILHERFKLYLNRGGAWGNFSIGETIFATSIEALNNHYYKWNKCKIKEDNEVTIQKVFMDITFEEVV